MPDLSLLVNGGILSNAWPPWGVQVSGCLPDVAVLRQLPVLLRHRTQVEQELQVIIGHNLHKDNSEFHVLTL